MSRRQENVHTGGFCEHFSRAAGVRVPALCTLVHKQESEHVRCVCNGTVEEHAFVCGRGGELVHICKYKDMQLLLFYTCDCVSVC